MFQHVDLQRVAGLTGIKNITHKADIYLTVKNIDGTITTITPEGVYVNPTVKYNLVSVAELASLNFESRFGRHQSLVHEPAVMHVPLMHTCNVYAIDATSNTNHLAFTSISTMTNLEKAHLYCSVLLCFINPRVRNIRNEASSCSGILSCNQRGQSHPSLKERCKGPAERVKETRMSMHHLPARQNCSQTSSTCSHWQ